MNLEFFLQNGGELDPRLCVDAEFRLAVEKDKLVDGRRVSEVLLKNNGTIIVEKDCAYPGCSAVGSLTCRGNIAFASETRGDRICL